mmetsp:Transcript_37696/g.56248  ORF Transcript_37696/g.56248 Transcript_37696/m.56248 type:complete len:247 (-) Transcript_37696:482-1222(-)
MLRLLESDLVGHACSEVAQLPAHGELDSGFRDGCPDSVLLGQDLAEGLSSVGSVDHRCESHLADANGAHAMVDSSGSQAALSDFEAPTLAQEDILLRNSDVVEDDLTGAIALLVAEQGHHPQNGHSRSVARSQDHRMLAVDGTRPAASAHENKNLALRSNSSSDEPFVTIDDVVVPIRFDPSGDVRRVAGRHSGLGHGEGGSNFGSQERLQPLLLLLRGAVLLEDLHVACVRRVAIEDVVHDVVHA